MKTLLATLTIACLLSPPAFADATTSQVESFTAMGKITLGMKDPGNTLVVMDDDDTLTMMPCPNQGDPTTCQYLGGPAWFAWQDGLLAAPSPYRVAQNFDELLDISALLFAMNNMVYTEPQVPEVLIGLAASGVRLLVETARGTDTLSATQMQFSHRAVPQEAGANFLDLIATHSLVMAPAASASLASPFLPCGAAAARPVSYQQGAMFVAGQNKGQMLLCLLQRFETSVNEGLAQPIRNIVFIDDTQPNVDDVYNTFKDNPNYHVAALHYNALDSHKAALTVGASSKGFQDRAKSRWEAIRAALSRQLLDPALGH